MLLRNIVSVFAVCFLTSWTQAAPVSDEALQRYCQSELGAAPGSPARLDLEDKLNDIADGLNRYAVCAFNPALVQSGTADASRVVGVGHLKECAARRFEKGLISDIKGSQSFFSPEYIDPVSIAKMGMSGVHFNKAMGGSKAHMDHMMEMSKKMAMGGTMSSPEMKELHGMEKMLIQSLEEMSEKKKRSSGFCKERFWGQPCGRKDIIDQVLDALKEGKAVAKVSKTVAGYLHSIGLRSSAELLNSVGDKAGKIGGRASRWQLIYDLARAVTYTGGIATEEQERATRDPEFRRRQDAIANPDLLVLLASKPDERMKKLTADNCVAILKAGRDSVDGLTMPATGQPELLAPLPTSIR